MSEHEKTIGDVADAFEYSARARRSATDLRDVGDLRRALDALMAEHREKVERLERERDTARDAALEEAAQDVVRANRIGFPTFALARSIRALKSKPAKPCTCGAPDGDPTRLQAAHYADCPHAPKRTEAVHDESVKPGCCLWCGVMPGEPHRAAVYHSGPGGGAS